MKKATYILLTFTLSLQFLLAQTPNEDKNGNLEIKGEILVSQDNFELCSCISKAHALNGVKTFTQNEEVAKISAFVLGDWSSAYYVNDYSKLAGNILFKYEFIIKDGIINYRFYQFTHEQKDSEFESIGQLPSSWNSNVGAQFNKGQYWEIINAIQTNIAEKVQLISKQCLQG